MFDPALVSKLTHDHRQLPDIFKQVQAALARNIGAALVKRIEREERALYPPYLPTYRSDPVG